MTSNLEINNQNRIRSDVLFNAYLIESSDIMLAKDMAFSLVKSVIGENSTVDIEEHPDVKIIDTDFEIKIGDKIKISDIREKIIADCQRMPFISRRKFYIICDAGLMNEEAASALLKTLEEPPEYVSIILITKNKNLLLPTILSRCIIYTIVDTNNKYLISLYNKEYVGDIYEMLSFREKNYGRLNQFARQITKDREAFRDVLNIFRIIFRDAICYSITHNKNLLIFGNREADYVVITSTFTIESIQKSLEVAEKFLECLTSNIDGQLVLSEIFVCLRGVKNENSRG